MFNNPAIKTQIYEQNLEATFKSKSCLVLTIYRSIHPPVYLPIYYYDYYHLSLYKCEMSIIICLWNMENYQPDNKKITDNYKWMFNP